MSLCFRDNKDESKRFRLADSQQSIMCLEDVLEGYKELKLRGVKPNIITRYIKFCSQSPAVLKRLMDIFQDIFRNLDIVPMLYVLLRVALKTVI